MSNEEQRLVDGLRSEGLLDHGRLGVLEHEFPGSELPLRDWLVDVGFVDQATLGRIDDVVDAIDLDADEFAPDVRAVACLDSATARRAGVLPLALDTEQRRLTVVASSQPDLPLRDRVRRSVASDIDIEWRFAPSDVIAQALDRCYGVGLALADVVRDCNDSDTVIMEDVGGAPSPVARLVDALLADALARRASDIHINPEERFVRVRYRIDGVLEDVICLRRRHLDPLAVCLKVLAGVDIAETRRPQDGRFTRRVLGRRIDFRFASFPLCSGENVVLRVIERRLAIASIEALDLPRDCTDELRKLLAQPDGLLVVAGPTGGGKTSTLYALLGEIDASALNIMTLEDPIELRCIGLAQASLDAARGLDYASGVRALLRQDPDVLLIGEIRDAESCAMAMRAALSGHRVLTTVHADDAIAAVGRLIELGAERGVLADVLSGVVGQRLIRRRCTACASISQSRPGGVGCGNRCARCRGQGVFGRRALVEVLRVDTLIAEAIRRGAGRSTLRRRAVAEGHISLRQRAELLLASGGTTRTEINRVLGPDFRMESE